MTRVFGKTIFLMASALALSPVAAQAAERIYGAGSADGAYSDRGEGARVRGEVNCQGYCLPPGYRIEEPAGVAPPVQYEEPRGYVDEPVQYEQRDDRYGASRSSSYEEREGYSWGYERREEWERHDDDRADWDRDRCRPRYDARGDDLARCGEVRLNDSFFWGGGGVGPEYIDGGGGGGGGGGGYAEASAGAGAYASARASVGVSIRIGGRGGHKGGGHKGGCGKCGH